MEESTKPPINEEYIMSIVSDTHSGKKKMSSEHIAQVRQTTQTGDANIQPQETTQSDRKESKGEEKPNTRESRKRRVRPAPVDYESQFIKKADLTVRSGKGVYIRNDYHNAINRIISVIGNNEISITDYLDNILTHHFEYFEQEITEVFDSKYRPIITKTK